MLYAIFSTGGPGLLLIPSVYLWDVEHVRPTQPTDGQ